MDERRSIYAARTDSDGSALPGEARMDYGCTVNSWIGELAVARLWLARCVQHDCLGGTLTAKEDRRDIEWC